MAIMREVIPLTGGLRSLSPGVELLQQHGLSASGSELYLSKQQRAESDSNAQDPEPPSGKTLAGMCPLCHALIKLVVREPVQRSERPGT